MELCDELWHHIASFCAPADAARAMCVSRQLRACFTETVLGCIVARSFPLRWASLTSVPLRKRTWKEELRASYLDSEMLRRHESERESMKKEDMVRHYCDNSSEAVQIALSVKCDMMALGLGVIYNPIDPLHKRLFSVMCWSLTQSEPLVELPRFMNLLKNLERRRFDDGADRDDREWAIYSCFKFSSVPTLLHYALHALTETFGMHAIKPFMCAMKLNMIHNGAPDLIPQLICLATKGATIVEGDEEEWTTLLDDSEEGSELIEKLKAAFRRPLEDPVPTFMQLQSRIEWPF